MSRPTRWPRLDYTIICVLRPEFLAESIGMNKNRHPKPVFSWGNMMYLHKLSLPARRFAQIRRRGPIIIFMVILVGMQIGLTFHEAHHRSCSTLPGNDGTQCPLCSAIFFFAALIEVAPPVFSAALWGFLLINHCLLLFCSFISAHPARGPPRGNLSAVS